MNVYDSILSFHGTWRTYQARVLESAQRYLDDKKIHIVAAPGAGKTTLGIELIRRSGLPCLILSPRIVIRQQWLERIQTAFLEDGLSPETYLSNDICHPKLITSITYQTLFCGMTKYQGTEEEEDTLETEEVDFSSFDLLETVKKAGIQVICLDECHHLKNQWWKALETFLKEMGDVLVISLTATPPYDATPAQWERYCKVCGPVDEEISVPELVKEGSLCPHQDYVYFNYPSREEEQQLNAFLKKSRDIMLWLMEDPELIKMAASHPALWDYKNWFDKMLENPGYLSGLLIYCQAEGISFSPEWMNVLGITQLPDMSEKWMEYFLQGFLYEDAQSYTCDNTYREQLMKRLKSYGLLERKQVHFLLNDKIEKALINSTGKLQSIREIACQEYHSMGKELRMLVLTDYIRKEQRSILGNPEKPVDSIGVLPIFELLRREAEVWKLGVLCGSLILLPDSTIESFKHALGDSNMKELLKAKPLYDIAGNPLGYSEIPVQGNIQNYMKIMTELFERGEIEILIGTKSLLGEGWDSPCINALILASFVGSYVLSNQMRGRAIRTIQENPHKTSNIWHLVCLAGTKPLELSQDFQVLKRRMEGFCGVSYDGTSIENGMERLNLIREPFHRKNIQEINEAMIQKSRERDKLWEQWQKAVCLSEKMENTETCTMEKSPLKTASYFFYAMGYVAFLMVAQMGNILMRTRWQLSSSAQNLLFTGISLFIGMAVLCLGGKMIARISPLKRLHSMGRGILKALAEKGIVTSTCQVRTAEDTGIFYSVDLSGGTAREKHAFADCIEELLMPVENQRYLLCAKKGHLHMKEYYCVPALFSAKKEDAILFQKAMSSALGAYNLVYTRTPEGRRILLKARARAFANRNDRIINRKKKVKGVLE